MTLAILFYALASIVICALIRGGQVDDSLEGRVAVERKRLRDEGTL
jgi:hypothetical protein